jgi:hypothetical protein
MHVRVCPECDEEYRPDIAVCADCGAELRDRYENDRGEVVGSDGQPVLEPAVAEEAEAIELAPLFLGAPGDIKPLADALAAEGIPMRLVPAEGGRHGLVLWVAAADAERARAVLAPFAVRADELGLTNYALLNATEEDAAGYPTCPACNASLDAGAAFCPDCGLELRGAEE